MKLIRLSILFLALSFFSCGDLIDAVTCYHFDQRQCQTDEFGPDIAAADSSEWEGIMKAYLESKSIVVEEIFVNLQHYEEVCEACNVCPEMHRFYVKISAAGNEAIQELNLMNLKIDDCDDFF